MSSGYPEGKHDDPADTLDRLVRIGTKYQATAPAVADGDNAYLLVDAAGRPIIVGPAAEDAAVVGNPLLAGGRYDATDRTLDDGDVGGLAVDAAGRLKVAGPSANAPVAAMVGASEVKATHVTSVGPSTTRLTVITPTSGKKIRILAISGRVASATVIDLQFYFGTGASITTTPSKAIAQFHPLSNATQGGVFRNWPDGVGPVGAVDDVLSIKTDNDITTTATVVVQYREE